MMYDDVGDFYAWPADAFSAEQDDQREHDRADWWNDAPPSTPSSRSSRRSQRQQAARRERPPPGLLRIRCRKGVPPKAPSYYGHNDKYAFHEFKRKVDIWVVRSEPYMAASEQGRASKLTSFPEETSASSFLASRSSSFSSPTTV